MKNVYLLLLTIFMAIAGWAKTTTWTGGVNNQWDNPLNWDNGIPAANDDVVFPTNISATITRVAFDNNPILILNSLSVLGNSNIELRTAGGRIISIANGKTGNDFVISSGAQLTIGNNLNIILNLLAGAGVAGRFNVNKDQTYTSTGITTVASGGIINNEGTVTSLSTFNLIFQNNGTYIHARDGGAIPTANWNTGSKTLIAGVTKTAPFALSQTFANFTWSSEQNSDINLNGNLQNITGDLKITTTSGQPAVRFLNFSSDIGYTLNVGGNLIIERTAPATTNVAFINDSDGDAIINVAGNYTHLGGNLVFVDVNSNSNDGTAILNLAGNFVQSGGNVDFTSGDNGPPGQKGSMFIKGNFTQTAGTMRTTVGDNVIPNGLITFNKVGVQNYNATNVSYVNYVVANRDTLKLASALRISRDLPANPNWIGKMTINSGGTLDASTFVVSSQITPDVTPAASAVANFILLPGGKLITANATGVQGSISTLNNLTASLNSGADYEFQGASTGVFVTTTPNTLRDLIVNRAGGIVSLAMPLSITRNLTLTDGLLTTTTTNLPTVTSTGTASPATLVSFVNGPLAKAGATAFTFPVGKAGDGFRNIGITTPSASATFRAEFFRASPPAGTLEPTLTRVSACEYWDLSKTAGASGVSANVVLSWEANSNCGGAYVTNPVTLRVAHLVSGVWVDEGRLSSTGDATKGTITSADSPTTFSPFALASGSAIDNPLPVVFADVKAYGKNNGVQIEWSNLTEKDVATYSIERSSNGRDFVSIDQQSPTNNQSMKAEYNAFDANPYTGINFYRIKAEETSGKIVYSKILSLNLGKENHGLELYPNPVLDHQVTISLSNLKKGHYTIRVINTAGQDIFRQIITNRGSTLTQSLNLPAVIKPGVYHMVVTGDAYRENKMFIVR